MTPEALKELVLQTLDDMKGEDIKDINVRAQTIMSDYMVICTATSTRHLQAVADRLVEVCKAHGQQPLGVEGTGQDEWILVDLGDVIVHLMIAPVREHYGLEKLWGTKTPP